jgi:hypothetical protein
MVDFHPTAERWCPNCEEKFVATLVRQRAGREEGPTEATRCPTCGAEGQLLIDVPPEVRSRTYRP